MSSILTTPVFGRVADTSSRWPNEVTLFPQELHRRIVEYYFACWALLMPIASLLLIPGIQGTIPAYMLAFLSPIFCIQRRYLSALLAFFGGWAIFTVMSQTGLLLSGTRLFLSLPLVEPADPTAVFRSTLITQSLYLFACVLLFLFVWMHFKPSMMRYVFWGAWLLVLYGLFNWVCFTFTGSPHDFLSNRVFEAAGGDERIASWSQSYHIGPLRVLRLKSVTEEPSRCATLAVVYLSLAVFFRRRWLSLALLGTLVLTTSLTGVLGLIVMFAALLAQRSNAKPWVITIAFFAIVAGAFCWMIFPETFDELILSRVRGEHQSAITRSMKLETPVPIFLRLPFLNQLFGVGFGTCFLPGSMALLINCGAFGLMIGVSFILYPVLRLYGSKADVGIVTAVIVIAFIYCFISSAIYNAVIWMILGIAYSRITSNSSNPPTPASVG